MPMPEKILVVEDERNIASFVWSYFVIFSFSASQASVIMRSSASPSAFFTPSTSIGRSALTFTTQRDVR